METLPGVEAAIAGLGSLGELHALAQRAVTEVPGLVSAEFFTQEGAGLGIAPYGRDHGDS